ncbi:MAG TPA: ABC transporter transmembrane domain-containing protein, partial [Amycolatopsis sp.]|nr:ABC transporter transmembrane domain-containing protein [Amycolatopsis sp.]
MKKLPLADKKDVRRWIRETARDNRREFSVMLGLFCVATAIGLAGPRLLGALVDEVVGGTTTTTITWLAVAFVVVLGAQAWFKGLARLRARVFGERILASNREQFVGNALNLPLGTVEAAGTGDLLSRATTDVSRIDHAVRFGAPEILIAAVTVVFTVVAMVLTSPFLALGLLIALPLLVPVNIWYQRRIPDVMRRMLDKWSELQSTTHETA